MPIADPKLRGLYGRLTGLKYSIPSGDSTIHATLGSDYNSVVKNLMALLGEELQSFFLPSEAFYMGAFESTQYCHSDILRSKVDQLIGYLNSVYFTDEGIVEIGSLYKVISDATLSQRCSDLLTATGAFDRAVNQATQVLEDRIRTKAKLEKDNLEGTNLVNRAINSEVTKSVIIISDDPQEHEGIAHICRGIVGAFRNPTHHHLLDNYERKDALRLCGFIDQLLGMIDKAKVRQ